MNTCLNMYRKWGLMKFSKQHSIASKIIGIEVLLINIVSFFFLIQYTETEFHSNIQIVEIYTNT